MKALRMDGNLLENRKVRYLLLFRLDLVTEHVFVRTRNQGLAEADCWDTQWSFEGSGIRGRGFTTGSFGHYHHR